MEIDTGKIKALFRFERRDKIRIAACFALAVVEFVLLSMRYKESCAGVILFFLLSIPTFKVKGRFRFICDLIFPLYTALFVMYYFQLGMLYAHPMADALFSFWGYLLLQERVFYEIGFVLVVYFLFRLFCMSPKVAAIATPVPFMLIALINYYVYQFRGHELVFYDFVSVRTAANVAGNYSYPMFVPFVYMIIPYALFVFFFAHLEMEKSTLHIAVREIIFAAATCASVALSIFSINTWFAEGSHIFREWGDMMSVANGYYLSFAESIRAVIITPPQGYSSTALESALSANGYGAADKLTSDGDTANIIVIMNESYSDLLIYSDIIGNVNDPDPYWDSLDANTVHGNAMSSVFGGNTANSEFEFLTGLSMGNLPSSSIAYHSFVKDDMYSVVRALNDAGYDSYVMHPYLSSGWNRLAVYPRLGFEHMMFMDDFIFTDDDCICGKVSDECAYRNMLRILDEHDKVSDNKTFTYLITMQNHGGYYFDDYEPDLYTTVFDDYNNKCFNTFMTLINESDKALEMLLEELSSREDKYVVLVFGDHQPELSLVSSDDYSAGGRAWSVPYIVWTNFDMDDELQGELSRNASVSSLNYLSLDVLRAAGFEFNSYYRLLDGLRNDVPSINSAGFITSDGSVHAPEDKVDIPSLTLYRYIQYNILFDGNNSSLFKDYVYN